MSWVGALPWIFAGLGVVVAIVAARQGRHAAHRYRAENEEEAQDRAFQQKLIALEILGIPGNPDWPSQRQRLLRIHDRLERTERTVGRLDVRTADMLREMHPDSGRSMKDQLTELVAWKDSQGA